MKKFLFLCILFHFFVLYASERPKVGLVLSGGGARGIAHIPTLKLIDSLQIPIDYIAGTSIGGLGAALYAMGYSGAEIEKAVLSLDWSDLFDDKPQRKDLPYVEKKQTSRYQLDFGINSKLQLELPMGLIEGQKILLLFSKWALPFSRVRDFDELQIPFRCVTVDLISGKEVVLKAGSLARAIRATMSIPSIFSPVEWGDSLLIDGGIVNNLPVDVVREMGADIVIAVNVGTPLKKRSDLNSALDIFEQAFNIPGSYREQENISSADILITPVLDTFSSSDFDSSDLNKIEAAGAKAAQKAKFELVKLKESLNIQEPKSRIEHTFDAVNSYNPRIHSLQIIGNTQLPFQFIYKLLDLKPGMKFNVEQVNQNILKLYSLNYFKSIYYDIAEVRPGLIKLTIYVKEKPFRHLRLGLRYDDYYRLVIALSLQATNVLFPGIRSELQFQFPGLNRIYYKSSYPSIKLDQAIYPFLHIELLNRPRDQYNEIGQKIATYEENIFSSGVGLGLLPTNHLNLEAEFGYEIHRSSWLVSQNQTQINARLWKVSAVFDFDYLDDVLLPKNGSRFKASSETDMYKLGTKVDFYKMQFWLDYYSTIKRRHTFHLKGFYGFSASEVPIYKNISLGGPESFIGGRYDQFNAESAAVMGIDYRYRLRKDVYLKFLSNIMFEKNILNSDFSHKKDILSGLGLGLKYMSVAGPIQLIFARGGKSYGSSKYQNLVYVTGGYIF